MCDYARAVEVGREILSVSVTRTILHGRGFAGGLAIMAESVLRVADLLDVAVPSFGWVEGRRFLVKEGSGEEINTFLEAYPQREGDLMTVLSCFDPMNFAGEVRCPTLVGVGLVDDVVPGPHRVCHRRPPRWPARGRSTPRQPHRSAWGEAVGPL